MSLLPRVRTIMREIDPEVPLANARLIEDEVAAALAHVSFVSLLLGIAAAVAMVLAAVGLYGVISYVVGRRTREIGMRLAIGAQPREVERMVIGRTLGLVGLGLLVGVPLAGLASGLARGLLVGVEPTDPAAYVAAAAVMTLVALLASWLPARRAASVDPVRALRAE
jgi:putative ABC transport system permease protein